MRRLGLIVMVASLATAAVAGEAEINAAQQSIEAQLRAFQSGNGPEAYSYAAPNITRMFPTVETFMGMVEKGYAPVAKPRRFAFGASVERGPGSIMQQVMITGPDGKEYEAIYTLELQPDGTFRITGVSLRESKSLST